MYPYIRVGAAVFRATRALRIAPDETVIERTRCWPWDIDPFAELNNGRSLTLMDIGRLSLLTRIGLVALARAQGLRLTMAGSRVQYRARVRPFAPMEIRSRLLGRDARFFYIEHLTLTRGVPAHHALYRAVVVGPTGLAPTDAAVAGQAHPGWHARPPDWVMRWAEAENAIPWPPDI